MQDSGKVYAVTLIFPHRCISAVSISLQLSVLPVLSDSDLPGGVSAVNSSCCDTPLYHRHTNQYPHCLLFSFRNPSIRWNYVGMNSLKVKSLISTKKNKKTKKLYFNYILFCMKKRKRCALHCNIFMIITHHISFIQ